MSVACMAKIVEVNNFISYMFGSHVYVNEKVSHRSRWAHAKAVIKHAYITGDIYQLYHVKILLHFVTRYIVE